MIHVETCLSRKRSIYWKNAFLAACYVTKNTKFLYCEKATKFCEIFTLLLTGTTWDKSKVKISQNFMAFSENMNFKTALHFF